MSFSGLKPEGETFCDGPLHFLRKAKEEISKRFGDSKKIGIAVFGSVANGRNEYEDPLRKIYVGQNVYEMSKYVDVIWPMQYPSHWAYKGYKLFGDTEHPETIPAQVYAETTLNLKDQLRDQESRIAIVPWVQSFYIKSFGGLTMQQPPSRDTIASYTAEQIDGCMQAGCDGFAPWSTSASDIDKALSGIHGFVTSPSLR